MRMNNLNFLNNYLNVFSTLIIVSIWKLVRFHSIIISKHINLFKYFWPQCLNQKKKWFWQKQKFHQITIEHKIIQDCFYFFHRKTFLIKLCSLVNFSNSFHANNYQTTSIETSSPTFFVFIKSYLTKKNFSIFIFGEISLLFYF